MRENSGLFLLQHRYYADEPGYKTLTTKERTDAQVTQVHGGKRHETGKFKMLVGTGFPEAVNLDWGFEGCLGVCEAKNRGYSV